MTDPVSVTESLTLAGFVAGVLGNLLARHIDPARDSVACGVVERLCHGKGFPPNHDVERACRDSFRQTLRMMAQAMRFQAGRPKTVADAISICWDRDGNWIPLLSGSRWTTDESRWLNEFAREINSDESLAQFRLRVADASSLNRPLLGQADDRWIAAFRDGLLDWTERRIQINTGMVTGRPIPPPACFLKFVKDGWPLQPDSPEKRVTLYQVWCLFLQDQVKKNTEFFRILTVTSLAEIASRQVEVGFTQDQLAAELLQPLGELQAPLTEILEKVNQLTKGLGDLAIGRGALLALLKAYFGQSETQFDELKSWLTRQREEVQRLCGDATEIKADAKTLVATTTGTHEIAIKTLTVAESILKKFEDSNPIVGGVSVVTSSREATESLPNANHSSPTVSGFPANVSPLVRSGFIDCSEAFQAFERLLNPDNAKRILLLEGAGAHGKSDLTTRFKAQAMKILPERSMAHVLLEKPVKSFEWFTEQMIAALGVDLPKNSKKDSRPRKLLEARTDQPTILFIDGFEHAQDEHRLRLLTDFLEQIHLHPLLRMVISGRRVPEHAARPWAIYADHVICDSLQDPEAFVRYGAEIGSWMQPDDIRRCCNALRHMRDLMQAKQLPSDGLNPFSLITCIRSRPREGVPA